MSLTSELQQKAAFLAERTPRPAVSSGNDGARRSMRRGQRTHIPTPKAATSLRRVSDLAPVNSPDTRPASLYASEDCGECGRGHRTFTKHVQELVLENVRAGNYISVAARASGITADGLRTFVSDHPLFAEAIRTAKAEAETRAIDAINGSDSWQAQAFKLERRFPARWGKIDRKVVSGPDGGPVKHQVAVLMVNPDDYKRARSISESSVVSVPKLSAATVDTNLEQDTDDELEEVMSDEHVTSPANNDGGDPDA